MVAFILFVLYGAIFPIVYGNSFQDCGLRNVVNITGSEINNRQLEYPWHVAVYRQFNYDEYPKYICGGSIIHEKLVLTAAACVYDESIFEVHNATLIVAVGQINSSWQHRGPTEKRFKAVAIRVHDTYVGYNNRYSYNIAVLTLNESINFSYAVMPVCIDWHSEVYQTRSSGTVVGWRFPENNSLNIELAAIKIDFYNFTICRLKFISKHLQILTSEKFCAGPENAISKRKPGDGLVIPLNSTKNFEKYYLRGVLMAYHRPSSLSFYIDINKVLSWLESILTSVINAEMPAFAVDYGDDFKDCGIRYALNSHIPTINYGYEAKYSEYPWHVAIYMQTSVSEDPEYICGGSIIHRKLILTAAHCFYNETTLDINNATYFVIAGKYYRSWDSRDKSEQRFEVIEIKLPETYRGFINRYADDMAILVIKKSIRFSSVVMPICMDWNPEELKKVKEIPEFGTVVGWGITENSELSDNLIVANLKYYNFSACTDRFINEGFSPYITSDKFCAGLSNGTAIDQGDSGGGLVFPVDSVGNRQQFYLRGVLSTRDTSGTTIAAFTDINKHLNWLNASMLPFIEEDYCPVLSSGLVALEHCISVNGTAVDCNKPARLGTTAEVICKNSFHTGFPFRLYTQTECMENHTWSPLMDSCFECGKRQRFNNFASAVTEKPKKVPEFPWHVAVHRKDVLRNETDFNYRCGGTIIHPKAVLTVAQCTVDSEYKVLEDPKMISIIAGIVKISVKDSFLQKFQVSKIHIKKTFVGEGSWLEDDIAVLELNGIIKLNDYALPACIDWTGKLQLHKKPFLSALTPGWGIDEHGVQSDELRIAKLLFVNLTKCYKMISDEERSSPYFGSDKWCAVSEDGSFISQGDHGGSVILPRYNEETGEPTYFIYGLVSIKSPESDIMGLTSVLFHMEWIKETMTSIIKTMKKI